MALDAITSGPDAPEDIYVIVEIPKDAEPVKYEVDKPSGELFVDRVLSTPMRYPCNYGYIPQTLGGDGDPIDAMVLLPHPLLSGSVIRCRALGMLNMTDEKGTDEKLIVVPHKKVFADYAHMNSINDVNQGELDRIAHFFEHYKDLEKGKWVKIDGFEDAPKAKQIIQESIDRYHQA